MSRGEAERKGGGAKSADVTESARVCVNGRCRHCAAVPVQSSINMDHF